MSFMPATRGEHIHVRPRRRGRMRKRDHVEGHPVVGYQWEDGRFQETVILVNGQSRFLSDFLDDLPGNMRAETIPFSRIDCCEMDYGS